MAQVAAEAPVPKRQQIRPFNVVARFAPVLFLVVLMIGFSILEPRFLTPLNLFNVLRQVSIYGLLAIGMTFVILTAGIDLSIGSILALAGLVAAVVAKGGLDNRFSVGDGSAATGFGWEVAALAAIGVGVAAGFVQGLAITRFKVPPFVVTLGGMSAFRGAALLFSGGGPVSGFDEAFVWWGQGKLGPVPVPVLIFVLFAIIAHITLSYTRYGRQIYAVGGNPEAARLAGLNVQKIILSVYVITGFFAGLGAFVLAARLNSAEAVAGTGFELTVIASVVIGGTSLFGGTGTVFGTVIGTVLIGVLLNGLVLLDVSAYVQQIIIGMIIVLAVAFDTFVKSRRRIL
ncbi:MAG: ABC transporter permease [Mesorhizobium sp.]|uniref:ABC transporter permease n=1 Tax=Mesorhizobium sp. TaxID=1871066 RepID=UPI000FE7404B|nr:ABC transporter permease [Mesorhizobium sp.]RWM07647.1 MAG: ABC transporter permease [Mesorhizobium sp.]